MLGRALAFVGLLLPLALAAAPDVSRASTRAAITDVHALIERVDQLPRFSREAVERLFRVQLVGDPRFPGPSDPRARITEGPFSEVRFVEMRPEGAATSWRISVTIRRTETVPINEIDRQYIGRKLHGATQGPYESVGMYTLDRQGMLLHLRYGMTSRNLQDLTFVREGSPDRAAWEARSAVARAAAADLSALVQGLRAGTSLSRAFVEDVLGVKLVVANAERGAGQSWVAAPARGVASKVTYQSGQPAGATDRQQLTLEVRAEIPIPERLLDPRLFVGRPGLQINAESDAADEVRKIVFTQAGPPRR